MFDQKGEGGSIFKISDLDLKRQVISLENEGKLNASMQFSHINKCER